MFHNQSAFVKHKSQKNATHFWHGCFLSFLCSIIGSLSSYHLRFPDHYYFAGSISFCTLFPEKKQGARVDNGLWRDGEKFESGREKMNARLSTLTSCLSSITISDEILFSRDISPILAFYLLSFLVSSFSMLTFTLHIYLNCVWHFSGPCAIFV